MNSSRRGKKAELNKIFGKVGECMASFHRQRGFLILMRGVFGGPPAPTLLFGMYQTPNPETLSPLRRYGGRQHNDAGTQNILWDEDE